MDMAEVVAQRGTCFRSCVGAILTMDNNPISMGYNGPPSGEDHCHGNECRLDETGGCLRADHAEANAINRATLILNKFDGLFDGRIDLYTTHAPCLDCAIIISKSLVDRLYYRHPYRNPQGLEIVLASTNVFRVLPSGTIIGETTKQFINPETLK